MYVWQYMFEPSPFVFTAQTLQARWWISARKETHCLRSQMWWSSPHLSLALAPPAGWFLWFSACGCTVTARKEAASAAHTLASARVCAFFLCPYCTVVDVNINVHIYMGQMCQHLKTVRTVEGIKPWHVATTLIINCHFSDIKEYFLWLINRSHQMVKNSPV